MIIKVNERLSSSRIEAIYFNKGDDAMTIFDEFGMTFWMDQNIQSFQTNDNYLHHFRLFYHEINNLIYFIFFIFSYLVTFLLFLCISNHNDELHHFCSGLKSFQWLLRKCTFIQLFHYLECSFIISVLQTTDTFS